ncbi:MAG: DNA repair protein RecN [Bacteroidota bacterium]
MIQSIYIRNFALIDELGVQFGHGLNILTGQTGAGKSIIIGALNMILGERADTDVIRHGTDKAIAEATIYAEQTGILNTLFEEHEIEWSDHIILRREIRQTGSRAFINDTPVNIKVLRSVGDQLVDLHGQHDHQLLLKEEHHAGVVDGFGEVEKKKQLYRVEYEAMQQFQKKRQQLQKREAELQEKQELYRFQVKELEEARLSPEEEEELRAEMKLLDNAEVLDQKAALIAEIGSGNEVDIMQLLNMMKINLEDLARIEPEFEQYKHELNAARISINETIQFAERYRTTIEFNPQRLEELRQRQAELNRLQKKYQKGIPELIAYLADIQQELSLAENFDLELENISKTIQEQSDRLKEAAVALHDVRVDIGAQLSNQIVTELAQVGIAHAEFEVRVDWLTTSAGWFDWNNQSIECTPEGCDEVTFYISTNKGETPKALAKIASGGEISRVMLALKSILAREQSLPVMIFDEIDTGISGEISEKVGTAMRRLSSFCQIVAITHQPQIASQAHHHFKVEKTETEDRTISTIVPLSDEQHVLEIAGLMSGSEITESALKSARELIERNTRSN